MKNPLPDDLDHRVAHALFSLPVAAPPAYPLQTRRVKSKLAQWSIPATVGVGLVLAFALHNVEERPSFAQVVQAADRFKEYKIVNTRMMSDGKSFKVSTIVKGNRWKVVYDRMTLGGDGLETVQVVKYSPAITFVALNEPSTAPFQAPNLHKLLQSGAKFSVSHNVVVRGQTVDRFTTKTSYRDRGQTQTLEEEILADPVRKVPLEITTWRDGHSWGDRYELTYGNVSDADLLVVRPVSCPLYDYRTQRTQILAMAKQGTPFALLDELRNFDVYVPQSIAKEQQSNWVEKALRQVNGFRTPTLYPGSTDIAGVKWVRYSSGGTVHQYSIPIRELVKSNASAELIITGQASDLMSKFHPSRL